VCSDLRRFTHASKIVATEKRKLSTRSRFSVVNDPARTGGSSRFVETISFRKCEPLFKCQEAQSYRRLPAFPMSDNRIYLTFLKYLLRQQQRKILFVLKPVV